MVCRIHCQDHLIVYDSWVDIATTSRVSRCVVTLCRTIGVCLTVTNGSCYYCLLWFNPSTESPIFIRRRGVGVILTPRILWCILSVLSWVQNANQLILLRRSEVERFWAHNLDLSGSCDVIGHVTIGPAMCGFLLVVNMNRRCISHGCWDIELETFWGHLDLLGTCKVSCQVTTGLAICGFPYRWSIWTDRLSRMVYEILRLKYIGDSKTDFTSGGQQRVSLSFRT